MRTLSPAVAAARSSGRGPGDRDHGDATDRWVAHVGRLWTERLRGLDLQGATVLEIGPGFAAKVGHGLAGLGFRGRLILVEPDPTARAWAFRQHGRLLPDVAVHSRSEPVPDTGGLGRVDAVVANHVLDDLLLRRHLPAGESRRLFSTMRPGRPCSPAFVQAWRSLLGCGDLPAVVQQVVDDLVGYVLTVAPRYVVVNEYQSWQHGRCGLEVVHDVGEDVLRRVARALAAAGMCTACRTDGAITGLSWLTALRGERT